MRPVPRRPRRNEQPRGSERTQSLEVGPAGKRTGPRQLLDGLSKRAKVHDMARLAADRAESSARREAIADGKTPQQVRGAAARARAESIKRTAKQAGVTADTAARWVRGAQRAGKKAEEEGRRKIQRSLGGAKGVRAAQVSATKGIDLGKVTIRVDTGTPSGGHEERNISVGLDASAMAHIASLIREGSDNDAADAFEEHVLEKYGDGLSGIMSIHDVPGRTTWR